MTWTLPAPGPGADGPLRHHLAQAYRVIEQALNGSVQAGQDYYVGEGRIWITAPDGTKHYISVDNDGNIGADGVSAQPLDATLTALAATAWAANALPIGTGADVVSQVAFAANTFPARASTGNLVAKAITDFALTLLDDANAATARTTLGAVNIAGDTMTGDLVVTGDITVSGTTASLLFQNRSGSEVWQLYAQSNIARIYNGSADVVEINSSGDITADGRMRANAHFNSTSAAAVLSAETGPILIRPNGADTTTNQSTFETDGSLQAAHIVYPASDAVSPCGKSSNRWSVVYAATGTINTSDARDKEPVQALTAQERAAALAIAAEIGTYRWIASVQAKGAGARHHVGLTVQRAIEIMEAHGLDPFAYGFICYDEWPATEDRDGGNIYSFRHDQMLLFIAAGMHERLVAIEALLNL